MKKLLSLLLALTMLLSLVPLAVASADEDKPYKGMTIKVWDGYKKYVINAEGTVTGPLDSSVVIYAAYEEWAKENECTVEIVGSGNINELQAAINAGDVPDLVNLHGASLSYITSGLVKAWDEETTEYFANKYGELYTDMLTVNGKCYGIVHPWTTYGILKYNRTLCDEYGIKTPAEYFKEGTWDFEAFRQFMKDCTMDVNGDGSLMTVGFGRPHMGGIVRPVVELNEEGRLVSLLNTDRNRAAVELMYNCYTVDKSLNDSNSNGLKLEGNLYTMSKAVNVEPWMPTSIYELNSDGYTIETVPYPVWKAGEEDEGYKVVRHYLYYFMCNGADPAKEAAAIDLLDYVHEVVMANCDEIAGGVLGTEGFRTLKGEEGLSKQILDARNAALTESRENNADIIPEYDQEYVDMVVSYLSNDVKYILAEGLNNNLSMVTEGSTYESLWLYPTATSLAEAVPVHEAYVEEYNVTTMDPFLNK